MKKKVAAMAIAAIMAVSVLNGCSSSDMGAGRADDQGVGKTSDEGRETSSSGEKITLNLYWWGNQTRNDVTKKPLTSIWSRIRISRLRRNLRTGQDTG